MKDNPGVKVNVTPVDWGQAVAKLQTAIAGDQTPDVSQMGTDMMGQFAATGALEPVPANFDPSHVLRGRLEHERRRRHACTACRGTSRPGSSTTGPTSPRRPASPRRPPRGTTSRPMAKAMQDKGGAKWGISLGTKNWQEYFPFLWSERRRHHRRHRGKFTLNSPQAVEALTYYQSFFKDGLTPKSVPEGFDITPAFVAGTHPMFFSGPWHLGLIKDAGGAEFEGKWAIAPMPKKVDRDLVRRRQQPGRLQGQQEQGRSPGRSSSTCPTRRPRSPGTTT